MLSTSARQQVSHILLPFTAACEPESADAVVLRADGGAALQPSQDFPRRGKSSPRPPQRSDLDQRERADAQRPSI